MQNKHTEYRHRTVEEVRRSLSVVATFLYCFITILVFFIQVRSCNSQLVPDICIFILRSSLDRTQNPTKYIPPLTLLLFLQEVDEENLVETEADTSGTFGAESRSESDLKAKFELFYRSIKSTNDNNDSRRCPPVSLPTSKLVISVETSPNDISASQHHGSLEIKTQTHDHHHDLIPSLKSKILEEDSQSPAASSATSQPSPAATSSPLAIPFNPRSRPSL